MKKLFKIFPILSIVFLFSSFPGYAQETIDTGEDTSLKVRPFRIGVKIGFPNLIGGNLEYVTPILDMKLSVNLDYSNVKSDWLTGDGEAEQETQDKINFTYLDLGMNYYFFKPGKGLYGGVSYNHIKAEATSEYSDSVEYIKEDQSSFNVKLGAKLGGLFYFRPEIGYSFSPLPKKYDVLTVYDDGTQETRTDDWSDLDGPANLLFQGLMANIGFGFAF